MPHKDVEDCSEYGRSYGRSYRQHNHQYLLTKQAEKNKKLRERQKQWLIEYKKSLACACCGGNYPVTLQFHHRNREKKEFEIAPYTAFSFSRAKLLAETRKCDVVHVYEMLP